MSSCLSLKTIKIKCSTSHWLMCMWLCVCVFESSMPMRVSCYMHLKRISLLSIQINITINCIYYKSILHVYVLLLLLLSYTYILRIHICIVHCSKWNGNFTDCSSAFLSANSLFNFNTFTKQVQ